MTSLKILEYIIKTRYKKLFIQFDYKKEKLIQDVDNECNIKYPHYIKFHYDTYFTLDYIYDEPYIYDCLLYKVNNEITEEKLNKIKMIIIFNDL